MFSYTARGPVELDVAQLAENCSLVRLMDVAERAASLPPWRRAPAAPAASEAAAGRSARPAGAARGVGGGAVRPGAGRGAAGAAAQSVSVRERGEGARAGGGAASEPFRALEAAERQERLRELANWHLEYRVVSGGPSDAPATGTAPSTSPEAPTERWRPLASNRDVLGALRELLTASHAAAEVAQRLRAAGLAEASLRVRLQLRVQAHPLPFRERLALGLSTDWTVARRGAEQAWSQAHPAPAEPALPAVLQRLHEAEKRQRDALAAQQQQLRRSASGASAAELQAGVAALVAGGAGGRASPDAAADASDAAAANPLEALEMQQVAERKEEDDEEGGDGRRRDVVRGSASPLSVVEEEDADRDREEDSKRDSKDSGSGSGRDSGRDGGSGGGRDSGKDKAVVEAEVRERAEEAGRVLQRIRTDERLQRQVEEMKDAATANLQAMPAVLKAVDDRAAREEEGDGVMDDLVGLAEELEELGEEKEVEGRERGGGDAGPVEEKKEGNRRPSAPPSKATMQTRSDSWTQKLVATTVHSAVSAGLAPARAILSDLRISADSASAASASTNPLSPSIKAPSVTPFVQLQRISDATDAAKATKPTPPSPSSNATTTTTTTTSTTTTAVTGGRTPVVLPRVGMREVDKVAPNTIVVPRATTASAASSSSAAPASTQSAPTQSAPTQSASTATAASRAQGAVRTREEDEGSPEVEVAFNVERDGRRTVKFAEEKDADAGRATHGHHGATASIASTPIRMVLPRQREEKRAGFVPTTSTSVFTGSLPATTMSSGKDQPRAGHSPPRQSSSATTSTTTATTTTASPPPSAAGPTPPFTPFSPQSQQSSSSSSSRRVRIAEPSHASSPTTPPQSSTFQASQYQAAQHQAAQHQAAQYQAAQYQAAHYQAAQYQASQSQSQASHVQSSPSQSHTSHPASSPLPPLPVAPPSPPSPRGASAAAAELHARVGDAYTSSDALEALLENSSFVAPPAAQPAEAAVEREVVLRSAAAPGPALLHERAARANGLLLLPSSQRDDLARRWTAHTPADSGVVLVPASDPLLTLPIRSGAGGAGAGGGAGGGGGGGGGGGVAVNSTTETRTNAPLLSIVSYDFGEGGSPRAGGGEELAVEERSSARPAWLATANEDGGEEGLRSEEDGASSGFAVMGHGLIVPAAPSSSHVPLDRQFEWLLRERLSPTPRDGRTHESTAPNNSYAHDSDESDDPSSPPLPLGAMRLAPRSSMGGSRHGRASPRSKARRPAGGGALVSPGSHVGRLAADRRARSSGAVVEPWMVAGGSVEMDLEASVEGLGGSLPAARAIASLVHEHIASHKHAQPQPAQSVREEGGLPDGGVTGARLHTAHAAQRDEAARALRDEWFRILLSPRDADGKERDSKDGEDGRGGRGEASAKEGVGVGVGVGVGGGVGVGAPNEPLAVRRLPSVRLRRRRDPNAATSATSGAAARSDASGSDGEGEEDDGDEDERVVRGAVEVVRSDRETAADGAPLRPRVTRTSPLADKLPPQPSLPLPVSLQKPGKRFLDLTKLSPAQAAAAEHLAAAPLLVAPPSFMLAPTSSTDAHRLEVSSILSSLQSPPRDLLRSPRGEPSSIHFRLVRPVARAQPTPLQVRLSSVPVTTNLNNTTNTTTTTTSNTTNTTTNTATSGASALAVTTTPLAVSHEGADGWAAGQRRRAPAPAGHGNNVASLSGGPDLLVAPPAIGVPPAPPVSFPYSEPSAGGVSAGPSVLWFDAPPDPAPSPADAEAGAYDGPAAAHGPGRGPSSVRAAPSAWTGRRVTHAADLQSGRRHRRRDRARLAAALSADDPLADDGLDQRAHPPAAALSSVPRDGFHPW